MLARVASQWGLPAAAAEEALRAGGEDPELCFASLHAASLAPATKEADAALDPVAPLLKEFDASFAAEMEAEEAEEGAEEKAGATGSAAVGEAGTKVEALENAQEQKAPTKPGEQTKHQDHIPWSVAQLVRFLRLPAGTSTKSEASSNWTSTKSEASSNWEAGGARLFQQRPNAGAMARARDPNSEEMGGAPVAAAPSSAAAAAPAPAAALRAFEPTQDLAVRGASRGSFQSISAMPDYANKSFEELRAEHHARLAAPGTSAAFATAPPPRATKKPATARHASAWLDAPGGGAQKAAEPPSDEELHELAAAMIKELDKK